MTNKTSYIKIKLEVDLRWKGGIMKHVKKKIVGLVMVVILGVLSAFSSMATETPENIVVGFTIIQIPTEYSTDDYYVVYDMNGDKNYAYIYEKGTDELVGDYAEIVSQSNARYVGEQVVHAYTFFHASSQEHLATKVRCIVKMKVYSEFIGGRQVNTILEIKEVDQDLPQDSPCIMESKMTSENRHTTTYCDVNCTGVLRTDTSSTIEMGASAEFFESLGFSVNHTSSSNWYARLAYNKIERVEVIH